MSQSNQPPVESRAGDGVEIGVTQARAGVWRGLYKVLAISTLLAVIVLGLVWIAMAPRGPITSANPPPAADRRGG